MWYVYLYLVLRKSILCAIIAYPYSCHYNNNNYLVLIHLGLSCYLEAFCTQKITLCIFGRTYSIKLNLKKTIFHNVHFMLDYRKTGCGHRHVYFLCLSLYIEIKELCGIIYITLFYSIMVTMIPLRNVCTVSESFTLTKE